jgi:UDP-glucose:(heptosyl)LPS alpha-1,3-glucosyltransferase
MKIGLVRRGFSATGGAERYLLRFAEAAQGLGHVCVLFSAEWPSNEWPGPLVRLDGASPSRFSDALEKGCRHAPVDVLFSLERVSACDVYRAGDGVHAAWLERRARHEPRWRHWWRRFQPKHREILRLERTLFSGGASRIIANSKMIRDEIVRHFGCPADRIAVIYNGVPAPRTFAEGHAAIRARLGLPAGGTVILFAGSGWDRKGLHFAIRAVNRVEGATLVVVGEGRRRGLPTGHRIRFAGPQKDIAPWLAAADAFILPTLYDPFSNATIEALAMGKPAITTSANGCAELIEHGLTGWIVEDPADIAALAEGLRHWSDPARRQACATLLAGRRWHDSIQENTAATLEVLRSAARHPD